MNRGRASPGDDAQKRRRSPSASPTHMYARDRASQALGMTIAEVGPGTPSWR